MKTSLFFFAEVGEAEKESVTRVEEEVLLQFLTPRQKNRRRKSVEGCESSMITPCVPSTASPSSPNLINDNIVCTIYGNYLQLYLNYHIFIKCFFLILNFNYTTI